MWDFTSTTWGSENKKNHYTNGHIEIQYDSNNSQNIRFQGQYADQETGLTYNIFRFFDPTIGNFVSEDPIGIAGGINLYKYGPNPISWIDPLGWASHSPGIYDVLFEARLPTSEMYRLNDPAHFSESNRQLYYAIKNDQNFAANIESKYPGISKWVSPTTRGTFRGKAFSGTTWHHHSQVGGLLQLVDMNDHRSRHLDYHHKGVGGRNKWGGGTGCR